MADTLWLAGRQPCCVGRLLKPWYAEVGFMSPCYQPCGGGFFSLVCVFLPNLDKTRGGNGAGLDVSLWQHWVLRVELGWRKKRRR